MDKIVNIKVSKGAFDDILLPKNVMVVEYASLDTEKGTIEQRLEELGF